MIYIGCDPGKNGGLAILQGEEVQTFRYDRDTYRCVLSDLRGEKAVCCLEHVGVMPKNGSVSMFHFGENFGWLQGMLEAYEIPYELVRPQKWKKEFSVTADKNTSIEVCKRLVRCPPRRAAARSMTAVQNLYSWHSTPSGGSDETN
jgi:crossover junction endodeoxyribonuclease RuvC